MRGMSRRGFTVIELLVTVAIIAVIAAILFPVASGAKRKGKDTTCLSNMRQIGMAFSMYLASYDDRMPDRLSRMHPSHITDPRILICPHDPNRGQYPDSMRLEGSAHLPTGVSYTWVPNWDVAIELGWWKPWPNTGSGKWLDQTPISECHWQWATKYGQFEGDQTQAARFSAHLLLFNGSVVKWPGRVRVELFSPDP